MIIRIIGKMKNGVSTIKIQRADGTIKKLTIHRGNKNLLKMIQLKEGCI